MNENHFLNRRNKLLERMEAGVAIIASASPQTRSNDTEYPYRQNSDFYYLCGFDEDNSVLVLIKTAHESKTLLFVEEINDEHALWNGARLGVARASEKLGIDEVRDIAVYPEQIQEILREHTRMYIDLYDEGHFLSQAKQGAKALQAARGVKSHIRTMHDLTYLIRSMRLIKSEEEIALIKKAVAITAEAHHEAMRICRGGMMEYELQARMTYQFQSRGALCEAYGAIVAVGNNANTLHYIDNRDILGNDDLVLIDAACEWELYASDITRTFPVSGKFTEPQKELYEKILEVQLKVIAAMKPGVKRDWLQRYSEELLCQLLIDLGILHGDLDTLLESKAHKKYAPHGIGHWMGLDVHDPCPYVDESGESLAFLPGMVMTVEPGIYIRSDDESVEEKYRGIGIRIEDDILITEEGCENLSYMIAKTVEEIEGMCR